MRIGFLNNQIDNRGTGNAVFDYAHYNEAILGNKSVIYTFPSGSHDKNSLYRYQRRFGAIHNIYLPDLDVDVLYHIKSGYDDGFRPNVNIPYLVHSVFENHPHGDRYATISPWMGQRFGLPFVPHIIGLPDSSDSLRPDIGIPDSAIVFGRHGGADSFDIPWVWDVIQRITEERDDVWFLFMNTNRPDIESELNNHVVFVEPTANQYQKRAFINSCDAMIHARARGETFGIAVGEFAILGKPVITYAASPERAHFDHLHDYALEYDEDDLYGILEGFKPVKFPPLYTEFTPKIVMSKFKEVFLDGINTGG